MLHSVTSTVPRVRYRYLPTVSEAAGWAWVALLCKQHGCSIAHHAPPVYPYPYTPMGYRWVGYPRSIARTATKKAPTALVYLHSRFIPYPIPSGATSHWAQA